MVPGDSTHRCQKSSFGTGGNNHPVPKGGLCSRYFKCWRRSYLSTALISLPKGKGERLYSGQAKRGVAEKGGGRRRRRRGGGAEDRRRTADAELYSFLSRWISFVFLSGPPQSVSSLLFPNPLQVLSSASCLVASWPVSHGDLLASPAATSCHKRGRREGRSSRAEEEGRRRGRRCGGRGCRRDL